MSIFAFVMKDLFGHALLEYQNGKYSEDIETSSSLDEHDVMPLPYLFRGYEDMPSIEKKALQLCKGRILDIGCGAGSHCLHLQRKGFEVIALDSSKGAIETCGLRGIKNRIHTDILDFDQGKFDTLLMLMNGIGIVGKLENLGRYLKHLKTLLRPDGQILLDSSDIIYMFEDADDERTYVANSDRYYGEVEFSLRYKNHKGAAFSWLYVDYRTLRSVAETCGIRCEIVEKGEHYDYLARLW